MDIKQILSCATALAVVYAPAPAVASSHREAPAISLDPSADNTDVWAWVTPGTHDKLYVVAAFNPMEEPSGGPNFHKFSDDVLYEVHVTRGNQNLDDVVTFQFRFTTSPVSSVDPADLKAALGGGKEFFAQLSGQKQTLTIRRLENGKEVMSMSGIDVAPPNIGPQTNAIVYKPASGKYDDAFAATFVKTLPDGSRVWAGPRDDGFYVDLARIFDLANVLSGTARDGLAGFNCHAIALEVPTMTLTGTGKAPTVGGSDVQTLGIWSSASRRKVTVLRASGKDRGVGPWMQVSRLGLPLVNEALIGLQDKDKFNRTRPGNDVANFGAYFLNPVLVRDAETVGIYKALNVPQDVIDTLKTGRLDIVDAINLKSLPGHAIPLTATGDVLRVDLGLDSAFPNGRPLIGGAKPSQEQADVTDVLLSLILTKKLTGITDGVNANDRDYLPDMPYLALPWEGYGEGHGKVQAIP